MEETVATRLARMEATVARLARAVDGVADAVAARVADAMADARPLVLTTVQLKRAVRDAMDKEKEKVPEEEAAQPEEPTPPPKKKAKKTMSVVSTTSAKERMDTDTDQLSSPSALTLTMLDTMVSYAPTNEPVTIPTTPSPPPARAPRTVAPPPPPPQAPVYRAPPVAPSRPIMPSPQVQAPLQQQQPRMVTPTQSNAVASNAGAARLYLWGNAWHHLPEDYEFPKASIEVMWRQWCCGDSDKGFLPLRAIQASDIATTNNRKRLSDLKFLMKFIEQHLLDRGVWKDSPSEIEADQMLRAVRGAFPFTAAPGKKGQKREVEDLKWHSAVTLLRTANKKARAE